MPIILKRIYDEPSDEDGYRVLVDRLWPRGVEKDAAKLDEWLQEIAPSTKLRKSFHEGEATWGEFRRAYLLELRDYNEDLDPLIERAGKERVTLLYGSSDDRQNNAAVVKQFLDRRTGR